MSEISRDVSKNHLLISDVSSWDFSERVARVVCYIRMIKNVYSSAIRA